MLTQKLNKWPHTCVSIKICTWQTSLAIKYTLHIKVSHSTNHLPSVFICENVHHHLPFLKLDFTVSFKQKMVVSKFTTLSLCYLWIEGKRVETSLLLHVKKKSIFFNICKNICFIPSTAFQHTWLLIITRITLHWLDFICLASPLKFPKNARIS